MKNMKKYNSTIMKALVTIILFTVSGIVTLAQTPDGRDDKKEEREKIIQMKVAYVREHLALSESDNKRFLPVYEEDLRKEEAFRHSHRGMMRKAKHSYQQMTDAEVEKVLYDELVVEQQMLDLKKAQFDSYKKLIPIKKVLELKLAEHAFNKMLMQQLREKRPATSPQPEGK
jgi:hypothetical protein